MRHVKSGQSRATGEHIAHVFHLGSVEMRHVKSGQRGAFIEHTIHIFHFGGVEMG